MWAFKYEPDNMNYYIAGEDLKLILKAAINNVPNMMLFGLHGIGKGTFVNIFLKENKFECLKLNASQRNSVDDIRDTVNNAAKALAMSKYKIIYMNECDLMSPEAQETCLQLIEDVHKITRFIFVGNHLNRMIPELQSRCTIIEFPSNPPVKEIYNFCQKILSQEHVKYEPEILKAVIKKYYPDIRKTINAIEFSTVDGVLEKTNFFNTTEVIKNIYKAILDRDLDVIRNVLRSNKISYNELYTYLFDNLPSVSTSPGDVIIEIAEHSYRDYFCANKEINFIGMLMKLYKGIL